MNFKIYFKKTTKKQHQWLKAYYLVVYFFMTSDIKTNHVYMVIYSLLLPLIFTSEYPASVAHRLGQHDLGASGPFCQFRTRFHPSVYTC